MSTETATEATELQQCYNKGCGMKFKPDENHESACRYHPGVPVFHDAMKGWSCCKKRSTDFTTFLNMPGCESGCHDPVKPPEPEKPVVEPLKPGEEIIVKAPLPPTAREISERPPDDLPMEKLRVSVSSSLKRLLKRLQEQEAEEKAKGQDIESKDKEVAEGEVKIGTKCTYYGCDDIYIGPDSNFTRCQHHPGVAIFHDGYKFWSCCQRRTSDFHEFERQEGCTTGDHVWIKPVTNSEKCRYDWHQTGSLVVISLYVKASLPESTSIEANPTRVQVSFAYNNGKNECKMEFNLYGVIDPAKSSVELLATKVELKLRKADPSSWPSLEVKQTVEPKN